MTVPEGNGSVGNIVLLPWDGLGDLSLYLTLRLSNFAISTSKQIRDETILLFQFSENLFYFTLGNFSVKKIAVGDLIYLPTPRSGGTEQRYNPRTEITKISN